MPGPFSPADAMNTLLHRAAPVSCLLRGGIKEEDIDCKRCVWWENVDLGTPMDLPRGLAMREVMDNQLEMIRRLYVDAEEQMQLLRRLLKRMKRIEEKLGLEKVEDEDL